MCRSSCYLLSWIAGAIIETATDVLGKTSGGQQVNRETWWWNEQVQECIKEKKTKFKKWQKTQQEVDRQEYLLAKKGAKKAVAEARIDAYTGINQKLESWEGQKGVYKLAKSREKATRDIAQVKLIKDREGRVIQDE